MKSIFENRIKVTIAAFIIVLIFILIEHYNGGVETHYLLAREDLPGISNWWGLLTIPLLGWIVSTLTTHRRNKKVKSKQNLEEDNNNVLKRFIAALIFGIVASILWEFNLENILQYFILLPILIALFIPVHLPEFLLGFVLGMMYTFGGILPIIVGLVLLTICFVINELIRFLKNVILPKLNN